MQSAYWIAKNAKIAKIENQLTTEARRHGGTEKVG